MKPLFLRGRCVNQIIHHSWSGKTCASDGLPAIRQSSTVTTLALSYLAAMIAERVATWHRWTPKSHDQGPPKSHRKPEDYMDFVTS